MELKGRLIESSNHFASAKKDDGRDEEQQDHPA
jgi:hypothetical protein